MYENVTFRLRETSGGLVADETTRCTVGPAVTHHIVVRVREFGTVYTGYVNVEGGADAAAAAFAENSELGIVLGAALYERAAAESAPAR